jgi:hypothetical protein
MSPRTSGGARLCMAPSLRSSTQARCLPPAGLSPSGWGRRSTRVSFGRLVSSRPLKGEGCRAAKGTPTGPPTSTLSATLAGEGGRRHPGRTPPSPQHTQNNSSEECKAITPRMFPLLPAPFAPLVGCDPNSLLFRHRCGRPPTFSQIISRDNDGHALH